MNTFDQSINAILLKLLLINKDIFSRFLNHVGRYGWIEQVVKNMFWHYKHFWPINECNFIEITIMNH